MSANEFPSKIRTFFQDRRKLADSGLLLAVLLLGAFLRFYRLGASGVGNAYYAATVKSMLMSWHNFFFAAFEPGGSLSVDKPPLGFWVQALSAHFLGVTGFALALPNAIAGVLSIFVVYKLVRRPFGTWAGLAAALVLAVMPVAVATERNNTIDGLLVFVLLLAAWAFLQAVYTGKLRWLFLGVFIVGVGFNIKMLQAFLPLPGFYALYFFGAKQKWWKKILHLAAATIILLVVSFSWAVAVDSVPAADRPYVDSTDKNTVMELIFGHNGIERLTSLRQRMGLDGGGDGLFTPGDAPGNPPQGGPSNGAMPQASGGLYEPSAALSEGELPQFSGEQNAYSTNSYQEDLPQFPGGERPQQTSGSASKGTAPKNNGGGPGGSMDFGNAGTLRLFTQPLAGEASWLLPFVLAGLVVLALALWKRPFDEKHASVILWAGWLLPETIYFTYSTGLMHAYYLIMLGAPVAALAGMTVWAAWQLIRKHPLLGWSVLALLVAGTLVFQGIILWGQTDSAVWVISAACIIFGLGMCCLALSMGKCWFAPVALSLLLAAMLAAPVYWSVLTTLNSSNGNLPAAGPAGRGGMGGMGGGPMNAGGMPGGMGGPAGGGMFSPANDGNAAGETDSSVNSSGVPGGTNGSANGSGMAGGMNSPANGGGIPGGMGGPANGGGMSGGTDDSLLKYLLANTKSGTYLVATGQVNEAANYILATGRPVLTFGGFLGQYNEVSVDQLAALVNSGRLRFVLAQGLQGHQEIAQWVQKNCTLVDISSATGSNDSSTSGSRLNQSLYDCGG